MFAKLIYATIVIVILAGTLLLWRQQRLALAHQTAVMDRRIRQHRQQLWQTELTIGRLIRPASLEKRIRDLSLPVEPAVMPAERMIEDPQLMAAQTR